MVTLYDENFEKRDKFSTKPAEKGPKNYVVRALCFSPDSSRLAVAQSDCIVFVYKLGLDWGEVRTKDCTVLALVYVMYLCCCIVNQASLSIVVYSGSIELYHRTLCSLLQRYYIL